MSTPVDVVLDALRTRGSTPRANGGGWVARCPAHDDRVASLTIGAGNDGRALVKCHAGDGCAFDEIVGALGLEVKDLFPPRDAASSKKIEQCYRYVDESGVLLFEVVRWRPKGFAQRRPDGNGGWEWKLGDVRRVLYRLPEVVAGVDAGRWVLVTEGEKDADRLAELGFVATTSACGAGKWRDDYAQPLAGGKVAIVPDNDEPGRAHAEEVARSCAAVAEVVKIVELPGTDVHGDVSAWLANGGDAAALKALVEGAPEWLPDASTAALLDDYRLDDVGNAQRLHDLHGTEIRYVAEWGRHLDYDRGRGVWIEDHRDVRIMRRATDVVEQLWHAVPEQANDDERKRLALWATQSGRDHRIRASTTLVRGLPGVAIEPGALDSDPDLFNTPNGVIDLATGTLRAHDPRLLLSQQSEVPYDPKASAPTWLAFLERVQPDPEVRAFLQRFIGYCLTGHVSEHAFVMCVGQGANGKSTFTNALRPVFGTYAGVARRDLLIQSKHGPHDSGRAALQGRRLMTASEIERGDFLSEVEVKELTGGEPIAVRRLYGEVFEIAPTWKFLLSANYRPRVGGTDEGIWRRNRLVDWHITIGPEERDANLGEKLRAEAAGILAWAVQGNLEWRRIGLAEPASVIVATESYRASEDVVGRFLNDNGLTIDPNDRSLVTTNKELGDLLEPWNLEQGERLGKKGLHLELQRRGALFTRTANARAWRHLGRNDRCDRSSQDSPHTRASSHSRGEVSQVSSTDTDQRPGPSTPETAVTVADDAREPWAGDLLDRLAEEERRHVSDEELFGDG